MPAIVPQDNNNSKICGWVGRKGEGVIENLNVQRMKAESSLVHYVK